MPILPISSSLSKIRLTDGSDIARSLQEQAEGIYYISFRNSVKIKAIPEYTIKFKCHSDVLYLKYKGAVLFLR